ncbi:Ribonuclease T2 [Penicillium chermesinum]|uniref:ribonuclease T2 n=1 Tax=Penicillium chermesinum TaxID=63820 RepID=A0A9W9TKW4_9EURO|nr:Ribonuclease T2 [Penicillium chermesinum]KAJ5226458.1 Ribonuclease T2 [Penicillium chermesinum]KAJ6160360.1 Ribonuclease T2 [Penicillium chermesinum]
MFFTRSLAIAAAVGAASAQLKTCSNSNNTLSCHSSSKSPTCCFSYPGGALLQTQFWDTDPATGPSDSWTIHGLWPDNCDGTYQANCDSSRAYTNITAILKEQGRTQLLSYMDKYWVDINGDNEQFWEHEWSKHGTCVNTIDPSCYTNYQPQEEVGDYFQKVVDLFKTLDSYTALSSAGITPDDSKTYDLSDIEDALAKIHGGQKPYVGCESGALNQLYYFYNIGGNAITGQYKAAAPLEKSNCPSSGIKYTPKSGN